MVGLFLEATRLRRAFLDQQLLVVLQLLARALEGGLLIDALEGVGSDVLRRQLGRLDRDRLQGLAAVEGVLPDGLDRRAQGELCQLDAALLALGNDALAIEALRTESFAKLLDAGLCRMLTLYDEAKADFRRAYQLTEPVQTSFFRDLLKGFAQFSTEYDARFHAKDAEQYVDFCYPLLHGSKPDEDGLFAVCAYYRALKLEGEFLRLFSMGDIHTLMQRYAARFRTVPEMIAENIAELVFRHWIAGALTGCPDNAILLPEETADALIAQFSGRTKQDLEAAMRQAIVALPLTEDAMQYLTDAVPALAAAMEPHITDRNLQGWFA